MIFLRYILIFCYLTFCAHSATSWKQDAAHKAEGHLNVVDNTALEWTGTLLVSTIDGYLTAIDAANGIEKWRFREGPLLESPVSVQRGFTFIPNPRDGQLYLVVEGRLSKLPFTIPHLVRVSPCKSSDGVFYAGSKKDVWISVNPETGERINTFASGESSAFCPASHARAIHIGKTEYHIQMVDTKKRDRHWNATFVDYSSHLLPEDTDYPLQHFTNSADGRVLTVDEKNGLVLWNRDFGSVIVNMYLLKGDGMHKLPSTAIGSETFNVLAQGTDDLRANPLLTFPAKLPSRLFPTLYVGESAQTGLYALPAYVDERTNTIAPKYLGPPLLEGPKQNAGDEQHFEDSTISRERPVLPANTIGLGTTYTTEHGEFLLLGYHEFPKTAHHDMLVPQGREDPLLSTSPPSNVPMIGFKQNNHQQKQQQGESPSQQNTIPASLSHREDDFIGLLTYEELTLADMAWLIIRKYPNWLGLFIGLFFIFVTTVFTIVAYRLGKQRDNDSRRRTLSSNSTLTGGADGDASRSSRTSMLTAFDPENTGGGQHQINKLQYDSHEVLGTGCDGTVVYRGKFDGRDVAVKRILTVSLDKEHWRIIEREVTHLRESDSHPNVIRYFCSESDAYFHYIALELCDMSLDEFVRTQAGLWTSRADKLDLLKQASDGIAHLHQINIIHRDVKPKNILLNTKNSPQNPRVKISDFGLCKTVKIGHNSISKVSGVVGTEGWMAPELFTLDASVTYAVDVFSLGCVYYFVLSDGEHPFGDSVHRMANIIRGQCSLERLDENAEHTSRMLIAQMLRVDARQRPSAASAAAHPLFWQPSKQLQFLMEVSDYIEKMDVRNPVMRRLEWRRDKVVGNWLDRVDELLRQDLLKQRHYQNNVRDLLRALRNKKHHYQELSLELRTLLGALPNQYLAYFDGRFPKLLMHVFMAMCVVDERESLFQSYFSPDQLREFYIREREVLFKIEGPMPRRTPSPGNWRRMEMEAKATIRQQDIMVVGTGALTSNLSSPYQSPTQLHSPRPPANGAQTTTTIPSTQQHLLPPAIVLPSSLDLILPQFDPSKPPPPILAPPPQQQTMSTAAAAADIIGNVVQQAAQMDLVEISGMEKTVTRDDGDDGFESPKRQIASSKTKKKGNNNNKRRKGKRKKAPFSVLISPEEEDEQQDEEEEESEAKEEQEQQQSARLDAIPEEQQQQQQQQQPKEEQIPGVLLLEEKQIPEEEVPREAKGERENDGKGALGSYEEQL